MKRAISAGLLALFAAGSVLAQPPAQPSTVTTVAPVELRARAPIPDVGPGAPYFMPDELRAAEQEARAEVIVDRAERQFCAQRSPVVIRPPPAVAGDIDPTRAGSLRGSITNVIAANLEVEMLAREAALASQAALEARARAVEGAATREDLERTELARQGAVNAYLQAVAVTEEMQLRLNYLQQLIRENENITRSEARMMVLAQADERRAMLGGAKPDIYAGLSLVDLEVREVETGGDRLMRFTGKIHNGRRRPATVPALWFSALDAYGYPVRREQTLPNGRRNIAAGDSVAFAYEFKPAPPRAVNATVAFAPEHANATRQSMRQFCNIDRQPQPVEPNPAFRPPRSRRNVPVLDRAMDLDIDANDPRSEQRLRNGT